MSMNIKIAIRPDEKGLEGQKLAEFDYEFLVKELATRDRGLSLSKDTAIKEIRQTIMRLKGSTNFQWIDLAERMFTILVDSGIFAHQPGLQANSPTNGTSDRYQLKLPDGGAGVQ